MKEASRIKWIDGLKLIACFCVYFGHYVKSFFSGQEKFQIIEIINKTLLSIPLNGEFWVFVFCILSGYLVNKKNIIGFTSFINSSIVRYLRFLFTCIVINGMVYVWWEIGGFNTSACAEIVNNEWIGNYYINRTSAQVWLVGSLGLTSEFNPTFWVIRHLLLGAIIIYFFNYVKNKTAKILLVRVGLAIFTIVCLSNSATIFVGACLLGVWLEDIWKYPFNNSKRQKIVSCVLLVLFLVLSFMQNIFAQSIECEWMFLNEKWHVLYAVLFIICIGWHTKIKMFLERDFLIKNAYLSFPVYLLHWPIICSVGSYVFIAGSRIEIPYIVLYLGGYIITTIIVLMSAQGWAKTIGACMDRVLLNITYKLNKCFG